MSNLTAAVLRPQIEFLENKISQNRQRYNRLAEILSSVRNIYIPSSLEKVKRAPDSLQFNLLGLSSKQVDQFVQQTGERGVPIQIFGRDDNSRYYKNWQYSFTETPSLEKTESIISSACDLRLPSSFNYLRGTNPTMEQFLNSIKNIDYSGFPVVKICLVIVILMLTQILRQFFVTVIVKRIEKLVGKTNNFLDVELIQILKPSLSWLILLGGLWLVKSILAENLGTQLSASIGGFLNIIFVFIIAYVIYRGSSLLGQIVANYILHTETDLDLLLKPFLPKIFQAVAIIVLAIKVSELFLGQSAAALVGLLGGAGITLGLVFKDIVYDWFCTVIIYSDNIYREGDWLGVIGLEGFVQVLKIGFRTTTLHIIKWGSIIKMPNSKMISGVGENWSQNAGNELQWGINLNLKIDGISAKKTAKLCDAIEEIPKSIKGLSERCIIRFKQIENNARVIEIMAFVNDDNLYFDAEKNLNLALLELLEKEQIDCLSVMLIAQPTKYMQTLKAIDN